MSAPPPQQRALPQQQHTSRREKKKTKGKGKTKEEVPQRLTMQDPELCQALMGECSREERMPRGSVFTPSENVTLYLKQNDVRPLKKPSPKFPKANYYCRLCDYHCDNLTICITHIKDTRHSRLTRKQDLETTLYHLPDASKHHLDQLEAILQEVQAEHGLSEGDLLARQIVASQVSEVLSRGGLPGVTVRLFGSSLSGFGLKDSHVDLELQLPDTLDVKPHEALLKTREILCGVPVVSDVRDDFKTSKIPKIYFRLDDGRFTCEISLSNHNPYQTSLLLRDYMRLDPRVRTLGTAVRRWARLCLLDNQPLVDGQPIGTLPPHTFAIMLVFFLQQETKPVLPCIHDFLESKDVDTYTSPTDKLSAWKTRNTRTAAELFIDFFEFFSLTFRTAEVVVSIRDVAGISKTEKMWKGKKLTVEDPFSLRRSLTKSVSSTANLDFVMDCIKIAYLYFGTVQTKDGPVITKILVPDRSPDRRGNPCGGRRNGGDKNEGDDEEDDDTDAASESSEDEENNVASNTTNEPPVDILAKLNLGGASVSSAPPALLPSVPRDAQTLEMLESTFKSDEDDDDALPVNTASETLETFLAKNGRELTPKQARRVTELVPKNMISFQFDGNILTMGQKPTLFCTVCSQDGHLQNACPEERLEPLRPLPHPSQDFMDRMNEVCRNAMYGRQPDEMELRDRATLLKDLNHYIRQRFEPKSILNVFGSSSNGFAFANSDMDISLTFSDHPTDGDLQPIDLIERLAQKLKHMNGIRNVEAITSAKVPIIKFRHFQSRIEADISLYNVLALENTNMLRLYSEIDPRVKVLGYLVKRLAKECDIGDASRGSLSSYAYILMLIHFLQKIEPPVIPVLQELYPPGTDKPQNIVNGWNAWYFSSKENLPRVWPHLGRNPCSAFQLWILFLEYYAQGFDDRNLVVSIRQHAPLTKFEKMWISPTIAIEDPFDLAHNLGAAISRKMHIFIKKTFARTRERFGIQLQHYPKNYMTLQEYVWDSNFLMDGPPPNDRGCRACGRVGHLVRDCPRKVRPIEEKRRGARRVGGPAPAHGAADRDNRVPRAGTLSERANAKPGQLPPMGAPHQMGSVGEPQQQAAMGRPEQKKSPEQGPPRDPLSALFANAAPPQQQQPQLPPGLPPGLLQRMGGGHPWPPQQQQQPPQVISVEDLERRMMAGDAAAPRPPPPSQPAQPQSGRFGDGDALRRRQQAMAAAGGPQQAPPGFGAGLLLGQPPHANIPSPQQDQIHNMLAASAASAQILPQLSQLSNLGAITELQLRRQQEMLQLSQQQPPMFPAGPGGGGLGGADFGTLGLGYLQQLAGENTEVQQPKIPNLWAATAPPGQQQQQQLGHNLGLDSLSQLDSTQPRQQPPPQDGGWPTRRAE